MNFSQIKCFLAAADCLSFTRAADRLYLSQPVLSRQIASMEEELGMELFKREKKTVHLTPAGQIMLEGFKKLSSEYTELVERASAVHNGFEGRINIGMIEGQLVCPPFSTALAKFHEKYPNVQAHLSKHNFAGLRHALDTEEIDLCFTAEFEVIDDVEYEYREVGKSHHALVIPKSHPLADKEGLTIDDFKDEVFLSLPESESPHIAAASRMNASHGIKTLEAPNIGTLALWLEAGYGIFTLNTNHSLRNNPNLRFIEMPEFGETIEVVMWKKSNRNPIIASFVEQFDTI